MKHKVLGKCYARFNYGILSGADGKTRQKEKSFCNTQRRLVSVYHYAIWLCNAPATFQRIIEKTLSGLQWKKAVLYLDDIVVFGKNFEEHISNLEKVFDRLDEMNLKVKAQKCSFFNSWDI